MNRPDVLLVSMPWEVLKFPSIQLGILERVLEGAGIGTEVRSLKLAFMEHCVTATSGRPDDERIGVADYERVACEHFEAGLGDWIFAVPPFRRNTPEADEAYLAYLRGKGISKPDLDKALAMRALVPAFLERCTEEILAARPRIVGFTSVFSQNVPSLVLARMLRERDPSLRVVFGGANCDGPMGVALHRAFPWVDVVVRGEAERVLPDVVRDLLAGGPIRPQPGLCYRDGERSIVVEQSGGPSVAMDDVPIPNYDEYFERLPQASFAPEILPEVWLPFQSARGCWWGAKSHCTFCGLNGTSMAFRSKSPDRIVEELVAQATRYGRLDFLAVDEIIDLRYLRELLPRLRATGHDFRLFYETKSNLRRDQVRTLRETGVDRIQPGIESLSTPILELMRKGVTGLQNVRLLKWCAEYGVHPAWNVLYGLPGEPAEEYARMADVMASLTHFEPPQLVRLGIDRFSPYHERPREFGLELAGPLPYYRHIYELDDATLAQLAYAFDYRYLDGRDPETYVEPVRAAVERWQASRAAGFRSLRYRRGPGFLVIRDRRPNLDPADYSFGEDEARIYLACDDGATATAAWEAVRVHGSAELTVEDVQEFLDELVASRLVYQENGRYLSLALSGRLAEELP
jgi:ribosomal peptide maturation radical SAM protein 1